MNQKASARFCACQSTTPAVATSARHVVNNDEGDDGLSSLRNRPRTRSDQRALQSVSASLHRNKNIARIIHRGMWLSNRNLGLAHASVRREPPCGKNLAEKTQHLAPKWPTQVPAVDNPVSTSRWNTSHRWAPNKFTLLIRQYCFEFQRVVLTIGQLLHNLIGKQERQHQRCCKLSSGGRRRIRLTAKTPAEPTPSTPPTIP